MIENAVVFGAGQGLVGILSEPTGRAPGAPAVLLWNVGINHRVGPYRIFVDLARRLAADGIISLRFDVSGLGDSEVRRDSGTDLLRAQQDVREAMDFVTSRCGVQQFVLVGFCSSVDAAHAVAVADPRVTGVAYLEGYTHPVPGYLLRYPRRFLNPTRWERYLKARLSALRGGTKSDVEQVYLRDYPTREQYSADLRKLLDRGARLLFVYVAGDSKFAWRDQFYAMYGRDLRGRVDLEFLPDADHTFFRVQHRELALDRISAWLRTFPRAIAAAPQQTAIG